MRLRPRAPCPPDVTALGAHPLLARCMLDRFDATVAQRLAA